MNTDYHVLMQKFNNFKTFVKEISNNTKAVEGYEKMTDSEFLLLGLSFLVPNAKNLDIVVAQMASKLEVTDEELVKKIKRYVECFVEYLEQLSKEDNINEVIIDTVKKVAEEQNIELPKQ